MVKEIIKEDVPKIKQLLNEALGYNGDVKIERMGGLTNHSYKVLLEDDSVYVVRIPGDGTEDMINREDEKKSTQLACDLQIDAPVHLFKKDGSKVTMYIPNAITMSMESMKKKENIVDAAKILKKLHSCNVDTGVPFEVFDMAMEYEIIIKKNKVCMFDDYEQVKKSVMEIKGEIDAFCKPKKVPCHNDPLCENWIRSDDRMYLIDWEYSGMNDGMWDIADIAIEANYNHEENEELLKTYLNKNQIDNKTWKHFFANMIYVDFLWTLWAKTRVPFDGKPMEDWSTERYERLKKNLEEFKQY